MIAYRYLLLNLLGQGGMGRVWAARDQLLNRDVALKELVPPPGLTAEELRDLRERVMREARAIARLDHRNVVRVFDVLHDGGEPWIVMELVPSRSLHETLDHGGPMAPDRVARIGLGVLAALRAAHETSLLHRDVKPANVLMAHDGRVVLTDFGLATVAGDSSMTRTGIVMGSPSYLAPERALDHPASPASDLWSLGATLYFAVEGIGPHTRSTPMATLVALTTQPPRSPQRAGALTPALAGLLQKDPAHRIDAATAERLLRAAIEPAARPDPPAAGPPPISPPPASPQPAGPPLTGRPPASPPPAGPQPTGPPLTGPPPAGPPPAGPQPAGPQPAGPQPAGPQPAGPQPAGPQPAGPQPAGPPPAAPPSFSPQLAGLQPAGPPPAGPQPAGPPSFSTRLAGPQPAAPPSFSPPPAGPQPARAPLPEPAVAGAVPLAARSPLRRRLIMASVVLIVLAVGLVVGRMANTASPAGSAALAPLPSSAPQVIPSDALTPVKRTPSAGLPARQPAGKPPAPTAPKPSAANTTAKVSTPTTKAATQDGETPDVAAGKPFVNMMTGTCLDVPDGATTADLELWACQGVDNQSFAFASDGTLRSLGKCLQISDTSNGAHLRLTTCTGSAAQRFTYNSAYDLVSVKADKCVDVPDGNSANGITAQIWECTGEGNQKWHY